MCGPACCVFLIAAEKRKERCRGCGGPVSQWGEGWSDRVARSAGRTGSAVLCVGSLISAKEGWVFELESLRLMF
jgi:hypothetical protein